MRTNFLVSCGLAAVCIALSPTRVQAEHEKDGVAGGAHSAKPAGKSVSQLIGQPVINDHEEKLGKVHDVIVDPVSGKAPYAIIALNSSVSSTQNKIAVPLRDLKCSAEGKPILLRATPEALRTATKNLSGEWTSARDAEWAQKVDGFYGTTVSSEQRFAPDASRDAKDSRTFVRDPAPKGGELLIAPQDQALVDKVCENVDVVHVRVQNGVTHIYGSVPSEQARQDLETRVRSVQGVHTLESHLRVRNP
ncbi:MAG: PRC-barrel domain-containing protein [Verrucomicrobiales bacterium]|nr:PRC-barrel domain-containing protein [Verrucomicrobiales bacterium]